MVIGIVLAIGALALPFTVREIDRRREAEAFDRLGLLCRLARADARASGVPVVLRVDEAGSSVEARRLDPRDDAGIGAIAGDLGLDEGGRDPDVIDDTVPIPATWARFTLPDGCRCEPPPDRDDVEVAGFGEAGGPSLDDDILFGDDRSIVIWEGGARLVLFLPDGTAISPRRFGVRTPRGWRSIDIDPYGGRPTIGEVFDPTAFDESVSEIDDAGTEPAAELGIDPANDPAGVG